jgi:hypothetical protein
MKMQLILQLIHRTKPGAIGYLARVLFSDDLIQVEIMIGYLGIVSRCLFTETKEKQRWV